MNILACDTGTALLDGAYRQIKLLYTVAILAKPPYKTCEIIFSHESRRSPYDIRVILDEVKAIEHVLNRSRIKVDVVHLDVTLNAINLAELNLEDLEALDIPRKVKEQVKPLLAIILPHIKRIYKRFNVPIIAIGKDSVPIRLAEMATAVKGLEYAVRRVINDKAHIRIGLPRAVYIELHDDKFTARSDLPGEKDLEVTVKHDLELNKVKINQYPNPYVRGFLVIDIMPK